MKKKCELHFKNRIENEANQKSKAKKLLDEKGDWTPGKRPVYMNKLNRKDVSIIFKARTRMLDIKNNYKNKYKDTMCRGCKNEIETQEHILNECPNFHKNEKTKILQEDLYSENKKELVETAKMLRQLMTQLGQKNVELLPMSVQSGNLDIRD